MATQAIEICKTCAVFNAYDIYTAKFVQMAMVYIANTVTILAFSFALALGILIYAGAKVFPHNNTEIPLADLIPKIIAIIIASSMLKDLGFVWMIYEAILEWGTNVALGLMQQGVENGLNVPKLAHTDIGRLVGTAELYLWDFVGFAWKIMEAPGLFESFWDGVQVMVLAVIFGLLIFVIYGGLVLYFMFVAGRSLLYLQLVTAFSSLIVASLAFKETRGTFKAGVRITINAGLTLVACGFAMGITASILEASQKMIGCFTRETRAKACVDDTRQLADAMGVDNAIFADILSSFEVFAILIILGAFCWMVLWASVRIVSQLTETPDDSGPLAAFAGATAAMIGLGAGGAMNAMKKTSKFGADQLGAGTKGTAKLGAAVGGGVIDRMKK